MRRRRRQARDALAVLLVRLRTGDRRAGRLGVAGDGRERAVDRAARDTGADPLGYYVAPQAYAQMQVIEQAVRETGSLDDAKLAKYTRESSFKTVVGDVYFGPGGGWVQPRVLHAQFQNIVKYDIAEFRDTTTELVVSPKEFASGDLIYPYAKAKRP